MPVSMHRGWKAGFALVAACLLLAQVLYAGIARAAADNDAIRLEALLAASLCIAGNANVEDAASTPRVDRPDPTRATPHGLASCCDSGCTMFGSFVTPPGPVTLDSAVVLAGFAGLAPRHDPGFGPSPRILPEARGPPHRA